MSPAESPLRTHRRTSAVVKRSLDLVVSSGLFIILLPITGCVWVATLVTLGRPVLFRQERLGFQGQKFVLLKFRTMSEAADDRGTPLPDADRLGGMGRLIRMLSLDELPALLNVLRGEMSLVGPRPLLVEYEELYTPEQWRRHSVPPGLVGPVTAYGRNALSWDEKFELDCWYVDNWSLWLDFRLLARSLFQAMARRGVNADGHATMPPFEGNQRNSRDDVWSGWRDACTSLNEGMAEMTNLRRLVVLGGGGFGREVLDVVDAINRREQTFEVLGVVDDNEATRGLLSDRGVRYLGSPKESDLHDCEYVVGVGSPKTRKTLAESADGLGWSATSLVHPAATLAFDVTIGPGTVVTAGVRLTNHIVVGRHVHLNLNATVGHDATLADYVTVYPGVNISGNVVLEEGVSLGTGSAVIQGVTIGAHAILGAGAVAVKSLEGGKTYVGVPAKPLG